MSETKTRKVYTPEYKAKVALQALRSDKTINQIGQEFDVHPVQVSAWKKALLDQAKTLLESSRDPKPVDAQKEPEHRLPVLRHPAHGRGHQRQGGLCVATTAI